MLDFLLVSSRSSKKGTVEIYPRFVVKSSEDLMIRGGDFYAIWDETNQLWSTSEEVAIKLIDNALDEYAKKIKSESEDHIKVLYLWDAESGSIDRWHKYVQKQMRDSFHSLDEKLIFSNTVVTKNDYASRKLSYPLEECDTPAYDEIMETLYSEEEREKIEWAIGAIVSGDSKKIQKFIVMYGPPGSGKSTVLNIIQDLFDGYFCVFDAKALGSSNNSFALESFKSNPLVAIQHDGDLSRIEDNTRLNSLVSHEYMTVNEKFKSAYANRFNSFLFMGTNKPVKITDSKSGIIRRLIDVTPSGKKIPIAKYKNLVSKTKFELGGIASKCLNVYLNNPGLYDDYIPTAMLGASNDFYNFILDSYDVFKRDNCTTLKAAWEMYKVYIDDAKVAYPYSQRAFKEELKSYFKDFEERADIGDGTRLRNYYKGFIHDKFEYSIPNENERSKLKKSRGEKLLNLVYTESIFDDICSDCKAQYATNDGTPRKKWDNVNTKLKNILTSQLHYVKVPENHIVIDFDLKDDKGNKSFDLNAEAAAKWPSTYAEISQGGSGIHLHYIYTGEDPSMLSRVYDENIEIKVFTGGSSLRRKLTKCNNVGIATISSGLPLREESKVVNFEGLANEKALRTVIAKNLNKEYVPGTKPSIDFIFNSLEDAYSKGMIYDVSDLQPALITFAGRSSHHADYCLRKVAAMKFKSEEQTCSFDGVDSDSIIFFDVEVFPNLFVVVWKAPEKQCIKMINPSSRDIENLLKFKLIGFNNRRYDNHILYARLLGETNEQLFIRSKNIVAGKKEYMIGNAYNISYTDIYDFSSASNKQSLKKWEIQLGIHHLELGLPWDQPVPEELWEKVADYCVNDVVSTEATFNYLKGDWEARQMLAAISGGSVNDTTNTLTTRIIFGNDKHPKLVYTDLSTGELSDGSDTGVINEFPGYHYISANMSEDKLRHNMYRGIDLGFGGYVYSDPGMYSHVVTFDVQSMHPNSIISMNYFGDKTPFFKELLDARIAIKHKDYEAASKMLGGKLAPYLTDPSSAKAVSNALKTALNSCYGLTSASFENPMRDPRNSNNIVAVRGALFTKTIQDDLTEKGYHVIHCKTDSIKVVNPDESISNYIFDFAKKYGYIYEIEHKFEKICLVNKSTYIAKLELDDEEWLDECKDAEKKGKPLPTRWTATGDQFKQPYVFKKLFSKEPIIFEDLCETKEVKTSMYLDINEGLPDVSAYEKRLTALAKEYDKSLNPKPKVSGQLYLLKSTPGTITDERDDLIEKISQGHNYRYVGKVGQFCPMKPGCGGGLLVRSSDSKYGYDSVTGAKDYRWLESEIVRELHKEDDIDYSYYNKLVDEAVNDISKFGDFEWFVSED